MKTIGIVCPVYREEEVIGRFHERLSVVLAALSVRYRFKILYVLDPSPDKSEHIIASLCSREPNVSMLVLTRRFGHQAALIAGMDHCDADALITLDSDLQHPPELIPSLLERFEAGADIVQTIRRDVANRAAFAKVTSRWFYALMRRVGAVDLRSGAADYRLLSRRVVDVFRARVREQNQFVRGLVRWVGFRSEFVEFDCGPREAGRSKYGMAQLIVFALQGICSFSKAPLRLAGLVGAGMATLGFLYGAFVVVTYFVGPMIVPGWTSLLALVALLGGFQLIFLGVIGEYIGLIFDEVKHRPLYLVDRVYGEISDPSAGDARRASTKRAPLGLILRTHLDELGRLATGRSDSLFQRDLQVHEKTLRERIAGARVLVVGGAGSIGASTIGCALAFEPAALDVVDIDENALAELVRNLHARLEGLRIRNFRCLPLDYGGPVMERFLAGTSPYDLVLNFAALKHVRSEKDLYSLLQMLDVNLVKQARFKDWLARHRHASSYFAVSTDKAVNPTSMMGASKRLMEDMIFAKPGETRVTAARFANVAFSNGSLLQSWLTRLAKGQPLAVPADTRRYFVTIREAGEICLLAACCAPAGHILFPELDPRTHLVRMQDVAAAVVEAAGFEPRFVTDEEEARRVITTDAAQGRYPVLLTPLDTSGEKPYEEFVAQGERALDIGFRALRAIRHLRPLRDPTKLVGEIEQLIADPYKAALKGNLVALFRAALPSFDHVETNLDLDQRM